MSGISKILVIEDDSSIAHIVNELLCDAGYECEVASDGVNGLQRALNGEFSAVVLDVGLPLLNGLDVCRQIKSAQPLLPVIMLTARGDEVDVVAGIEVGADDYVQKPFRPRELLARIRARLREETRRLVEASASPSAAAPSVSVSAEKIIIGDIEIDPDRMRVLKRNEPVHLSAREYEVVLLLASHPGRPFTRDELLSLIWEFESDGYAVNVSVFFSRLRKKIEDNPEQPVYLITVRGVGYRFAETSEVGR